MNIYPFPIIPDVTAPLGHPAPWVTENSWLMDVYSPNMVIKCFLTHPHIMDMSEHSVKYLISGGWSSCSPAWQIPL